MVQDLFQVEVRLEDFRGEIENILYFSNLRRLLVQCSLFDDGSVIFFNSDPFKIIPTLLAVLIVHLTASKHGLLIDYINKYVNFG